MVKLKFRQTISDPHVALTVLTGAFPKSKFSPPVLQVCDSQGQTVANVKIHFERRDDKLQLVVTATSERNDALDNVKQTLASIQEQVSHSREEVEQAWWIYQEIGPSPAVLHRPNLPNKPMSVRDWSLLPHQHLREWKTPTSRHSWNSAYLRPHVAIGTVKALDASEARLKASAKTQGVAALLSLISDGVFEQWGNPEIAESEEHAHKCAQSLIGEPPQTTDNWAGQQVHFYDLPATAEALIRGLSDSDRERFSNALHVFHQGLLASNRSSSLAVFAMVAAGEALTYGPGVHCPACGQPKFQTSKRYREWLSAGLSGKERQHFRQFANLIYSRWRSKTAHVGLMLGTEEQGVWKIGSTWQ